MGILFQLARACSRINGMPRYKLTIEYDGTAYHGWQRQDNATSVQQRIEEAFVPFLKHMPRLHVCGRTDAGVHAMGQVAHVDLEDAHNPFVLMRSLTHFLQDTGVVILDCCRVEKDFHARFSATGREYVYKILNRPAPSVLHKNRVWHVSMPLDYAKMDKAVHVFKGTHDFTSFRSPQCQAKSPVKTLQDAALQKYGDGLCHLFFAAPSFLHHQVRNMVGTIVDVGRGKFEVEDIEKIFEAKDRCAAGVMAPACGLYFKRALF